jgi:hypothetical protein
MVDVDNILENQEDDQEGPDIPLSDSKKVLYETQNPDIKTLHDNYKDGDLILNPDYQRSYVWDNQKASNLIESLLLNIPIPIIYTSEDNGKEEVIDGQQRLQSIFSFMDGRFPLDDKPFKLSKLKILKELSGKKWADLDSDIQKRIKKSSLTVVKIQAGTQKDIKFEMFERLNTNTTILNAQELRNCLFRGNYNSFIKRLAKFGDFLQIIDRKESDNKRMIHEELVLIFCAFYNNTYLKYASPLKQFLNNDMDKFRMKTPESFNELERQFKKSVDLVKTIFGNNAFKIFEIDEETKCGFYSKTKVNQGLYFILMYSFTEYEKPQVMPFADLIREELFNLQIHNADFRDTLIGSGTNSKEKIKLKFDVWRNTLKGILGYPHKEPRAFSFKLKEQLFKADSTCRICDQRIINIDDAEIDHITCYWEGGKTIPSNARLAHRICNRHRSGNQIV